jgi:hypothetical protein
MNCKNQTDIGHCKKCNKNITGNFCSNCGNPNRLKRIDKNYITLEIGSVLNFDKGILYTIKELLIRPGATIRKFILEDRNRLVKPIIFIVLSSLIYTLFREFLNFQDNYIYVDNLDSSTSMSIFKWIQSNYGYGNIIMGLFIALWTKMLFKNYEYNFFEILVLLCFVMGIGMLLLTFFGIVEGLTKLKAGQFGGIALVIYTTWSVSQFFDGKKWTNYLKGLTAYFLGLMTFTILIILIGKLIDIAI